MNDADRGDMRIANLAAACAAYKADPSPENWAAVLAADDMAALVVDREVVL